MSELRESVPEQEPVKEYRPSDAEMLREFEITIRFLSGRGCVIRVGCKEIAFEDPKTAVAALNAYISNPYEESKRWNKIFKN